jgi:hypothetical protein
LRALAATRDEAHAEAITTVAELSRLLGANRGYIDTNTPHTIDPFRSDPGRLAPAALNDVLQARLKAAHHPIALLNPPDRELRGCTTAESAGKRSKAGFLPAYDLAPRHSSSASG